MAHDPRPPFSVLADLARMFGSSRRTLLPHPDDYIDDITYDITRPPLPIRIIQWAATVTTLALCLCVVVAAVIGLVVLASLAQP